MRIFPWSFATLLMTLFCSSALALGQGWRSPPDADLSFSVQGSVRGLSYRAVAELSWRSAQERYEATQKLRLPLLGTRHQSSIGRLSDSEGLMPEIFLDSARREYSVSFTPEQGQIYFSRSGSSQPWRAGVQDRLSVFFQLAGLIAAAPQNYPKGSTLSFATASKSDIKMWSFTVADLEEIELPAGRVTALRLIHSSNKTQESGSFDDVKDKAKGQSYDSALWLAPQWGYLPVRIRLQEGAQDWVDLQLEKTPR